jgi:hypothetical protein
MGRSSLATSLRGGHHWTANAAVVVTVTLVLVAASVVRTGSSRGRRNTGRRAAYSTDASEGQLQYCKLDRTYCSLLPVRDPVNTHTHKRTHCPIGPSGTLRGFRTRSTACVCLPSPAVTVPVSESRPGPTGTADASTLPTPPCMRRAYHRAADGGPSPT